MYHTFHLLLYFIFIFYIYTVSEPEMLWRSPASRTSHKQFVVQTRRPVPHRTQILYPWARQRRKRRGPEAANLLHYHLVRYDGRYGR